MSRPLRALILVFGLMTHHRCVARVVDLEEHHRRVRTHMKRIIVDNGTGSR